MVADKGHRPTGAIDHICPGAQVARVRNRCLWRTTSFLNLCELCQLMRKFTMVSIQLASIEIIMLLLVKDVVDFYNILVLVHNF